MLDVSATDRGLLIPRMMEAGKNAIPNPAEGLLIYQTDSVEGFYYFDGAIWVLLGSGGSGGGQGGCPPGFTPVNDEYCIQLLPTNTGNTF